MVIVWFLHECKERRWAVSAASARWFIEMVERERQPPVQKQAFNTLVFLLRTA